MKIHKTKIIAGIVALLVIGGSLATYSGLQKTSGAKENKQSLEVTQRHGETVEETSQQLNLTESGLKKEVTSNEGQETSTKQPMISYPYKMDEDWEKPEELKLARDQLRRMFSLSYGVEDVLLRLDESEQQELKNLIEEMVEITLEATKRATKGIVIQNAEEFVHVQTTVLPKRLQEDLDYSISSKKLDLEISIFMLQKSDKYSESFVVSQSMKEGTVAQKMFTPEVKKQFVESYQSDPDQFKLSATTKVHLESLFGAQNILDEDIDRIIELCSGDKSCLSGSMNLLLAHESNVSDQQVKKLSKLLLKDAR